MTRAVEGQPATVLRQAISRGLALVANADREDDGITAFDLEPMGVRYANMRLTVVAASADAAVDIALYQAITGLAKVTNAERADDGLLSFTVEPALADA